MKKSRIGAGIYGSDKKKAEGRNSKKPVSEKEGGDRGRARLMEKFTELMELPKEIVLNIPKMTIVGNGDMIIENYKGIIEYGDTRIRINTGVGIIKMTGSRLVVREITSEDIIINGVIETLEFIR